MPGLALLAGGLLLAGVAAAILFVELGGGSKRSTAPPRNVMSWRAAGAFVWHETDVDPSLLSRTLRDNGFGWVALRVHDGLQVDPVQAKWIERFRLASGLAVGGWGVLRTRPAAEARLAAGLVGRYGLDFYIADAEAEYDSGGAGRADPVRGARSAQFVAAFRRLEPTLPAAVSSYCRADQHDIDWPTWRRAGFPFLPQAYVDQFGPAASPESCVAGAVRFFPLADVHPTIGTFPGAFGVPSPAAYASMLAAAGTVGFSIYLAETGMPAGTWAAYGGQIAARKISG